MDLAEGTVSCSIALPEQLYYGILSDKAGLPIENEAQLLTLLMELAKVKQEYDKIADALSAVKATGYGVVQPTAEEMKLEKPEIIRKGGAYGVKLKAGAPSVHMVRVDIDTEISPMVGDEKQSRDLIAYLGGEEPEKLWQKAACYENSGDHRRIQWDGPATIWCGKQNPAAGCCTLICIGTRDSIG